jgi:hypothetical protein
VLADLTHGRFTSAAEAVPEGELKPAFIEALAAAADSMADADAGEASLLDAVWMVRTGAGILQVGATEPWVLSAAFPFFAVLFLIRHGWRRRPPESVLAEGEPTGIDPGGGSLAVC